MFGKISKLNFKNFINADIFNKYMSEEINQNDNIIELKEASISHKSNLILMNISLEIKRGEFVYFIGKTGTGKTTLLQTLYADLDFNEGECNVMGFNLKNIKRKEIPFLRRKFGIIFQDFQLLMDRSINENLRFVMMATGWKEKKLIEEKIEDVISKVGLSSIGNKMPFELSGGEQQREQ